MATSEIIPGPTTALVPQSFSQSVMATNVVGVGAPGPPAENYWHLVTNTFPGMNLKLTDVQSFEYETPWEQDVFQLAGRKRKVVEKSIFGPTGIEGSITALLHEKDLNNIQIGPTEVQAKIVAITDFWETVPDPSLIDPVGNAWRIEIMESLKFTMLDDDHGRVEISFDFVEV